MNVNIEELITINYELEGLLYLVLHRGEDTPQQIWSMINDKIDALREGIKISEEQDDAAQDSAADDTYNVNDAIAAEPKDIMTVHDIEETSAQHSEEALAPTIEYNIETETIVEEATEAVTESKTETEVAAEPMIEEETESEYEETKNETIESHDTTASDTEEVNEETYEIIEETPSGNEPIRLDEKLARQYSRDLRKAFSLNDRFRFRRELFGNSGAEMNDTLNLVEAMLNREEACDYFYHDLQWDRDNPEVIDFMAIIDKHFSNK